jgi:hypothetical protein
VQDNRKGMELAVLSNKVDDYIINRGISIELLLS